MSVIKLTATYFVCESKVRFYEVPYSIPNACIEWISLKILYSPVLVSFAEFIRKVIARVARIRYVHVRI